MLKRTILKKDISNDTKMYDVIIVGGGVAGVFIAEILKREFKSVLLIEKEKQLSSLCSGEHHGWGQFGSLYYNTEDPVFAQNALNNVDILLNDYPLPGNNLRAENGSLLSVDAENNENWFRSESIYHYMPDSDYISMKLPNERKEEWQAQIQQVLLRTQQTSNHIWGQNPAKYIIKTLDEHKATPHLLSAKRVVNKWMKLCERHQPHGFIAKKRNSDRVFKVNIDKCIILMSHDRPIRSVNIITSVFNHYLLNGGEVLFNTEIIKHINSQLQKRVKLISSTGEEYIANKIIYTTGNQLSSMNSNFKTEASPLLVVKPAVCQRNVLFMTPYSRCTINHIRHYDSTIQEYYSVIGNGDRVAVDDNKGMEKSKKNLLLQAETIFPDMKTIPEKNKSIYFGYKTEYKIVGPKRNYNYELITLENNIWAAIPGKFTFAPALAHYVFKQLTGKVEPPKIKLYENEYLFYKKLLECKRNLVFDSLHKQIVTDKISRGFFRCNRNNLDFHQRNRYLSKGIEKKSLDISLTLDTDIRTDKCVATKEQINDAKLSLNGFFSRPLVKIIAPIAPIAAVAMVTAFCAWKWRK